MRLRTITILRLEPRAPFLRTRMPGTAMTGSRLVRYVGRVYPGVYTGRHIGRVYTYPGTRRHIGRYVHTLGIPCIYTCCTHPGYTPVYTSVVHPRYTLWYIHLCTPWVYLHIHLLYTLGIPWKACCADSTSRTLR